MNCPDCRVRLQQRLDGKVISTTPELKEHLNECAACRNLFNGGQALLEGLAALAIPRPPADFTARLVTRVLEDRKRRRRRQRVRHYVILGMAASILLLALGYSWLPVPRGPIPPNPPIATNSPHEPIKPLAGAMKDAGNAVANMTGRITDQTIENAGMFFASSRLDLSPVGPENILEDASAQTLRHTAVNVAQGLEPIGQSARQAIRYFLRELPKSDGKMAN